MVTPMLKLIAKLRLARRGAAEAAATHLVVLDQRVRACCSCHGKPVVVHDLDADCGVEQVKRLEREWAKISKYEDPPIEWVIEQLNQ